MVLCNTTLCVWQHNSQMNVKFYMEVVNLKVKPKESFSGELTKGYKFDLKKSNQYNCEINNDVYYIIDKYGFKIPFSKEDFEETFVLIK